MLGKEFDVVHALQSGGPLFPCSESSLRSKCEPLAYFQIKEQESTAFSATNEEIYPALIRASFGEGTVLLSSPSFKEDTIVELWIKKALFESASRH